MLYSNYLQAHLTKQRKKTNKKKQQLDLQFDFADIHTLMQSQYSIFTVLLNNSLLCTHLKMKTFQTEHKLETIESTCMFLFL